jgi:tetratricopeptide (TPR) repeat protein
MAGSVRRASGRTRLYVRLADVATGVQIWAERYDVTRNATFEMQDDLAQRIAAMLVSHLRHAEIKTALDKPVERLDAYDLYLRGIAALRASEVSGAMSGARISEARTLLQRSLAAEPRHAAALISLSVTFMASWGTRRQDPLVAGEYRQDSVMEQALQCARQAVIAEPLLAEAHAQLGWCLHSVYRRHEAMEAYRRAFELNGCLTDRRYGLMLTHGGRHDEAIAFMQRAARRDPFQGPFHSSFGADPHYLIGDYRTALALSRAAAESGPAFARIRIWQAAAAARLGFDDEARYAARAALGLDPDLTVRRYLDQVRFARADDGWHLAAGLDAAGIPA